MNTVIVNEPHEQLELRPSADNNSISLVQKRRPNITDEWNIKVIILNVKQAYAVRTALEKFMPFTLSSA